MALASHDSLPQGKKMTRNTNDVFAALGLTLVLLRHQSGISQAELARRAGIGKSQLSKYERGTELPKLDSLGKLLEALNTEPLVFFYFSTVLSSRRTSHDEMRVAMLERNRGLGPNRQRESALYRELLGKVLDLFEAALAGRTLDMASETSLLGMHNEG